MPIHTTDRISKREATIRKGLTEKAEGMDPTKLRGRRKQLKRAQRKRRKIAADAARRAPKPAKSDA